MNQKRPVIFRSLGEDLEAACEAFMNVSAAKGLSPRTLEYYQQRLEAFRRFITKTAPDVAPSTLSPALVREFLLECRDEHSPATANHNRAVLYRLFEFLKGDGILEANPVAKVGKMKEPRPVIETFTPEQVDRFLATCDPKTFVGIRDRALILVLYDCGLRISEAINLTLEDVLWPQQLLRVMGKGQIGRFVPFGLEVRKALTRYLARRGELPGQGRLFVNSFGGGMDRKAIRWLVIRRAKKAGIAGARVTTHTFRHSFAVQFLRNGGDVFTLQRILGHSSLAMTRRYVELCSEDVSAAHRRFSPADQMKPSEKSGRKRIK